MSPLRTRRGALLDEDTRPTLSMPNLLEYPLAFFAEAPYLLVGVASSVLAVALLVSHFMPSAHGKGSSTRYPVEVLLLCGLATVHTWWAYFHLRGAVV